VDNIEVDVKTIYDWLMSATALFVRDGSTFVPTEAAAGPWDRKILHGAAVAALLAGQLTPEDATLARLTVELVAPVPAALLALTLGEPVGGRRVQRRGATLTADGRVVASATAVILKRNPLELPPTVLEHDSPFDALPPPPLDEPNRFAAELIGWESFDSSAMRYEKMRVEGDARTHQWVSLAVPVVEGTKIRGTELAAIAGDYAQSAVGRQLPFANWIFHNAELTLHLAREPIGSWIGMRCESVIQPLGAGFNSADLFDEAGRMGRAASTLVVERRSTKL